MVAILWRFPAIEVFWVGAEKGLFRGYKIDLWIIKLSWALPQFFMIFPAFHTEEGRSRDDITNNNNNRNNLHLFGIYYVPGIREEKELSLTF